MDLTTVIKERNLFLAETVKESSTEKIIKAIIEINDNDTFISRAIPHYIPEPIKLYIDSFGGSVYQMAGLIGVMETSKTPIYTYVTGVAASAGFVIAISGHKRFGGKYSTFMYHQVSHDIWGKLKELEENLKETQRVQVMLDTIVLTKTKLTKKLIRNSFVKKEDLYFNSEEALRLKIIDEII